MSAAGVADPAERAAEDDVDGVREREAVVLVGRAGTADVVEAVRDGLRALGLGAAPIPRDATAVAFALVRRAGTGVAAAFAIGDAEPAAVEAPGGAGAGAVQTLLSAGAEVAAAGAIHVGPERFAEGIAVAVRGHRRAPADAALADLIRRADLALVDGPVEIVVPPVADLGNRANPTNAGAARAADPAGAAMVGIGRGVGADPAAVDRVWRAGAGPALADLIRTAKATGDGLAAIVRRRPTDPSTAGHREALRGAGRYAATAGAAKTDVAVVAAGAAILDIRLKVDAPAVAVHEAGGARTAPVAADGARATGLGGVATLPRSGAPGRRVVEAEPRGNPGPGESGDTAQKAAAGWCA